MAIRPSSAKEIDALVADLGAGQDATRDAAIARLTIIGARAVERLAAVVGSSASAAARTAALHAIEAIGDPRARTAVLEALADPNAAVAAAAAAAARRYLRGRHGAEALDRLTQTALDRRRSGTVRAAAVLAVGTLDAVTIAPLLAALSDDTDRQVREAALAAARRRDGEGSDADARRGGQERMAGRPGCPARGDRAGRRQDRAPHPAAHRRGGAGARGSRAAGGAQ